jgi:hypothetical protein
MSIIASTQLRVIIFIVNRKAGPKKSRVTTSTREARNSQFSGGASPPAVEEVFRLKGLARAG